MRNRIRALLKAKGRSQADLARATGLSDGTISRVCSGANLPSEGTAKKIARYLRVSVEDLGLEAFGRTGTKPAPGRVNTKAIRAAIDGAGISIAELARRSKMTRQAIHVYLTGARVPKPATLRRIAKVLDLSPDEILAADE